MGLKSGVAPYTKNTSWHERGPSPYIYSSLFELYGQTLGHCNEFFSCCFSKASKKKVYMLYNLEPDQSVTGGPWYSASEFESEFVEILNAQAHKFLQQRVRLTYSV